MARAVAARRHAGARCRLSRRLAPPRASSSNQQYYAWPAARTLVQLAAATLPLGAGGVDLAARAAGATVATLTPDGLAGAAFAVELAQAGAVAAVVAAAVRAGAVPEPALRADGAAAAWGVGGAAAALTIVSLLAGDGGGGATGEAVGVLARASTAGAAALLVASCVLAPLIEETIYRGVLLAALRGPLGGLGPGASVAVAAAAFAASHAAVAPGDLAPLAALGAVLGAVRLGPGGLAAAALAHGLYNLGAFSVALADAAPR